MSDERETYLVLKRHLSRRSFAAIVMDKGRTREFYRASSPGWTKKSRAECVDWIKSLAQ